MAYQTNEEASAQVVQDRCDYGTDGYPPQDKLAACNELIQLRPADADVYVDRRLIFLDGRLFDKAVADFTTAHELDPKNPWPLANRGITHAWTKDKARAEKDFEAVRASDPSNPVMLRGEALLRMNAGDVEGAVGRLTASMVREPDNLWALRRRAELYHELGEHEKSAEDDRRRLQLMNEARVTRN